MEKVNSANDILVFDLGGTTMRAATYDPHHHKLANIQRCNTQPLVDNESCTSDALINQIFDQLHTLGLHVVKNKTPRHVVMGFPGPVSPAGVVSAAPTVWGSRVSQAVDVKQILNRQWPDSSVHVLNDVTAAGYRYLGNETECLSVVTVSSGIGNKLFVNGKPVTGPRGAGGEMGHLRIDHSNDAPICDCGGRGHLAAFSSGRASRYQAKLWAQLMPSEFRVSALAREIGFNISELSNEALIRHLKGFDKWAIRIVNSMAEPIGRMLGSEYMTTGVERFVIIGGFALSAGEQYLEFVKNAARASSWKNGADWDKMIVLGESDDNAGLIGGGRFAARLQPHGDM